MSHHCHDSCSHEGCHSGVPHHFGNGCCSCHNCSCPCHSHSEKFSDQLLELADEAWMEVLKEKLMDEIRKHSGDHLAKTAKLVAAANHLRWTEKLQAKRDHLDFEEELHNLMLPPATRKGKK